MKIIQSFWSKPYLNRASEGSSLGGWCNPLFFYMSWALSCLSLKRFYSDVELYTDSVGKKILIDCLKLPYSKVHVVLDDLNDYSEDLWAIGKLYTYSLQDEPFLHVDGDVYIWKPFSKSLLEAELIAQHFEESYPYNVKIIEDILSKLNFLPDPIRYGQNKANEVNAGILGGYDLDFFRLYTQEAFNFVNENKASLSSLKYPDMFNTVFEQFLFYCMAEYYGKEITYAFHHVDARFKCFGEFELIPSTYYIHTLAFYKQMFNIGEAVAHHLYKLSPEHYNLIINNFK